MNSILIFSTLVWISISIAIKLDYYWKDFDGYIPQDAFVAYLVNNKRIYVGQGYIKGAGIFPATIYPNVTKITVTANGNNPTINTNIKILCTKNINSLQWVQTNYNDIKKIQNIRFLRIVKAGTETDAPLYVGRHLHEGRMQIAKVYNISPYDGLNIPNKSGGSTILKDFEILVYCTIC